MRVLMFANYQLIARLLTLHSAATSADLLNTNKTELILAIPYQGDALRVYYKDTLLTDNFYSGYSSEQGGAVVGLSYLAGENPGLLADGVELTLMVLPLKKESLEDDVFLQQKLWPDFGSNGTALSLPALKWLVTTRHAIS
jgi:hypothetical protein